MKLSRVAIISIGVLILAAIVTIPLINSDIMGDDTMDKETVIPLIDRARPAVAEAATFALG